MLAPARAVQAFRRRRDVLRHHGTAVYCPLCGHRFDRFKDDRDRANALCWRCGSHERHRALWLLFQKRPTLLDDAHRLLHFAPEWCLRRRLRRLRHLTYLTADLAAPNVDLRLDITALELPDASFDAVLCSHVLEHVDDDAAAMRELRRITAPGGWALIMVPLDLGRDHTLEDGSVVSPEDRLRVFLQHDHVRIYAPDIGARLESAGFSVQRIRPRAEFTPQVFERCRLEETDELWLCRPA